jgi:hypothetical protein
MDPVAGVPNEQMVRSILVIYCIFDKPASTNICDGSWRSGSPTTTENDPIRHWGRDCRTNRHAGRR